MNKRLYLLRHGQTELNTKGVCQGSKNDSPLTIDGKKQTEIARQYINDNGLKFDVVYSSPLNRASYTATLVTDRHPIILDGLIEVDFGDLTGCEYSLSFKYTEGFEEIGGESFKAAENRFEETLKKVCEKDGENILCVSHGLIIKLFYCKLTGASTSEKVLPNLGIMEVEYDGENFKFIRNIDTQK